MSPIKDAKDHLLHYFDFGSPTETPMIENRVAKLPNRFVSDYACMRTGEYPLV